MNAAPMYFEDFYPGQQIDLGSQVVSEAEIIAFAREFDPQPIHVDHAAAGESIYGGVIASGWHTCSMMMRLVVDHLLAGASSMGSPGVDKVRWHLPVRAGDTLHVKYVTGEVKASQSKPDRGIVWSRWEAFNQRDELVCSIEGMAMFGRRPQEAAHA